MAGVAAWVHRASALVIHALVPLFGMLLVVRQVLHQELRDKLHLTLA